MDNSEAVFHNKFKERLTNRERQVGIWSNLASNISSEILSFAGFDWVLFDMEHAPNDIHSLITQLQAMKGSGTSPIVRPVWNDVVEIKRLLDIGFHNFIVPFVQNVDEAKQAVSGVRYPPRGRRGVSVGARGSSYGYTKKYWHKIEDHIGLVVQVETLEALDNIKEIFSVDGIDGIFVGPSDLAASMGHLADTGNPVVQKKLADIADMCNKINAPVGILATDGPDGQKYFDMGYTFVGMGSDSGLFRNATSALAQSFK